MSTPSQWNGQPGHTPEQPAPYGTSGQGPSDYGIPPGGQPRAYGSPAQGMPQANPNSPLPGSQPYTGSVPGTPGQPLGGYGQPGVPPQSGVQQSGAYPQAAPPAPRPLTVFPTLRDELSFSKNLFGMIALVSALGGWALTTLLSFVGTGFARAGAFEIYSVISPVQSILNLLTSIAAIVFGILALRAAGWRNMPAAVGLAFGVTTFVSLAFYFVIGLVPPSL